MDTNKLRNQVFEQTGIRIDTNDPVFALVALNDAVLAEGVERQREVVAEMTDQLASRTKLLVAAGDRYQRKLLGEDEVEAAPARGSLLMKALAGIGVAVLAAGLTIAGLTLMPRPAAPPPVPLPLTADQLAKIQNGEKFMKVLPKLDPAVQAQVTELMRAP